MQRMDELQAQRQLTVGRVVESCAALGTLPPDIIDMATAFERHGNLMSDSHWLKALLSTNVPIGTILAVWDLKNEASWESNDKLRDSLENI